MAMLVLAPIALFLFLSRHALAMSTSSSSNGKRIISVTVFSDLA
jgi:hypothetical protein